MNNTAFKILIPVDFSENTAIAISKALKLGHWDPVEIHLFHTQKIFISGISHRISVSLAGYSHQHLKTDRKNIEKRLKKLKDEIEIERPSILVQYSTAFGEPVQESIIRKARHLSADLIIIAKHSHHRILPFLNTVVPSKIAAESGKPVLTFKPGANTSEVKNIVIPIGCEFQGGKIEMVNLLNNETQPNINIVVFQTDLKRLNSLKRQIFDIVEVFKHKFSNNISYDIIKGENKVRSLINYCFYKNADMLIVYPGSETRVGNWRNNHISDFLPVDSKIQILAVPPL